MVTSRNLVAALIASLALGATACTDALKPASEPQAPPPSAPAPADYFVALDFNSGEVTVTSADDALVASGTSGRLYGNANQARFHFTVAPGSPSADPANPGKKLFRLRVRMENLVPHAVGTHVDRTTPAPRDTMGVFVYVAIPPYVTAGCPPLTPGCAGEVANHHGTANFSAIGQRYWYFREILDANDGQFGTGPDMSQEQEWVFRADDAVDNMVFGISMSAPWAMPNDGTETRFRVAYVPDSLPFEGGGSLRTEPVWKQFLYNPGSSSSAIVTTGCPPGAARCLQMTTPGASVTGIVYTNFRSDSLGAAQDAYVHAVIRASAPNNNQPSIFVGMQDEERFIQAGISRLRVGFTDAEGRFIGAQHTFGNDADHEVRVIKFASDSAQIWYNGSVRLTRSWAALPASPFAGIGPEWQKPTFWFGNGVAPLQNLSQTTSHWSSVVFEIGATGP